MLLCSHENLMDDHIMLNIAHKVVIANLKSQQPQSCTCVQIETILPCANCSPTSKSFLELEFPEIDDIVYQELKEENERIRTRLTQLKGKCIAQPSQDNRDDMVKKLETGTTVACTKSLEENVKDMRNVERKEQNKKINTSTKSLNHATNIQGNDQATLNTKKNKKCIECFGEGHLTRSCPYIKENILVINKDDRKCFRCSEKGHMVKSCPYVKQKGIVLEKKIFTNHVASKRQGKKKSSKHEDRLCYLCRSKVHLCKDCPIGNYSAPSLSIDSYVTRQPIIATCARKVMCLPSASTNDIWVPRSLLTNIGGPNKRWGPKYAWQTLQGKGDAMKLWMCMSGLNQFLSYQSYNVLYL
jgi:hypothetical protein